MDLHLSGRIALVTGVSRGIGLAVADELLAEGVRVMGTSRTAPPTRDNLEHLVEDMQDPGAGARAVTACVERLGRLDILVNNAVGARIMTALPPSQTRHGRGTGSSTSYLYSARAERRCRT